MRFILRIVCSIWEIFYKNMINARYLKDSRYRLLRVAYRKHKGQDKLLNEVSIKRGDLIAELHLSNLALLRYQNRKSPEWALYRDMISELHLLSKILKTGEKPVQALGGISLLAPALVRLGFTVEEINPGPWSAINYIWLRFLRLAFSPRKGETFKALDANRKPCEFWMSAAKFTERF